MGRRERKIAAYGVAALLLMGAMAWLLADEAPSGQTQQWMAEAQRPARPALVEAYYLLDGLAAPARQDAIVRGEEHLTYFRQYKKMLPYTDTLPLPSGPMYCLLIEPGCLQRIQGRQSQWSAQLKQHQALLARFEVWLRYEGHQAPAYTWTPQFEFPPYHYLLRASQLKVLAAFQLARQRGGATALAALLKDLERLRHHLQSANTLLGKMALAAIIANHLDALLALSSGGGSPDAQGLAQLTESQRALGPVLASEFYFAYRLFLGAKDNPESVVRSRYLPRWAVKRLFKPAKISNALAKRYSDLKGLDQMDAAALAEALGGEHGAVLEEGFHFDFAQRYASNPLGKEMGWPRSPFLEAYIARMHDLAAKFVLAAHALGRRNEPPANPYGPAYGIKRQGELLCFEGPLIDEASWRCVRKS